MKRILSVLLAFFAILTISTTHAEENGTENKKVLVAYFSATGTTAGVAKKLATAIDAELFEIQPQQPYMPKDLVWQDNQSRTSIEMSDRNSRPIIASKIENIEQYDVIFLGFPIWWGREPSIIDTFIESYNFSGKKIIPFVTSGSSGIGNTSDNLKQLAPDANIYSGQRFQADVSADELKTWAGEWL